MVDILRGKKLKSRFVLSTTGEAVADDAFLEATIDVKQSWILVPVLSGGIDSATPIVEFILTVTQGGDTEILYYMLDGNIMLDPQFMCEGKREVNIRMYNRSGGAANMRMSVNCYLYCNE